MYHFLQITGLCGNMDGDATNEGNVDNVQGSFYKLITTHKYGIATDVQEEYENAADFASSEVHILFIIQHINICMFTMVDP